jgi:hypothetical protein
MKHYLHKRKIAFFLLLTFGVQIFYPFSAFALTSGPSQPELSKFEPAGNSDFVDLFTGDLKYNIPILEVGGYPINLSYQSGTGIEDEASWVGAGWTLNPGTVNRNLRGLPDEFDGKNDQITKTFSKKEFKKVGGHLLVKGSLAAFEVGKVNGSFKVNLYKDNYWGIGAGVGASLGASISGNSNSPLTVGLDVGLNSDVREGVDVSPNFSIAAQKDINSDISANASLSGGFTYNTRAGLKDISLSASFSATEKETKADKLSYETSAVKYFGQTYTPQFQFNTINERNAFSLDFGVSFNAFYAGIGGGGYTYRERILSKVVSAPAYGYLNYQHGKKDVNALLDFNREKDGVFIASAPAIAIPVATQDYFTATSQTGSQQFRPFYGGNYVVYDRQFGNLSNMLSGALTIGAGNIFKAGGRIDKMDGEARTGKWVDRNALAPVYDTLFDTKNIGEEPVYFKQVGEPTETDAVFLSKMSNGTEGVSLQKQFALNSYTNRYGLKRTPGAIRKNIREKRNYNFSFLTATEASVAGLDKTINGTPRINATRKNNHISQISVTDKEGKRMIYPRLQLSRRRSL